MGGMVGAVLASYGPDKILWKGFLHVIASLLISPVLGLIFGYVILKIVIHFSRNASPSINFFFNRMQIPSSIALALSHGANDVQKSIGLIAMSFVILGLSPTVLSLLCRRVLTFGRTFLPSVSSTPNPPPLSSIADCILLA